MGVATEFEAFEQQFLEIIQELETISVSKNIHCYLNCLVSTPTPKCHGLDLKYEIR